MKILNKSLLPFKWIFRKILDGLQYVIIDKTNKVFLVLVPNFLFGILGFSILFYNFKNIKEDTTSLTNYGFAILVGLASVCFSWARGLTKQDDNEALEKVTKYGESFFHCAIIFLLLSAIKYAAIHLDQLILKEWEVAYKIIYIFLSLTHTFGFTLGFFKVERIICSVNLLLYERSHNQG